MRFETIGFIALGLCLVLSSLATAAEPLITPPADAPSYSLSGIRRQTDGFGRDGVVVDYTRTREGDGPVYIGVRGRDGSTQLLGGSLPDPQSGQIHLSSFFGSFGNATQDIEVYFYTSVTWAESISRSCLISNTVRMGNPSGSTSARSWTAEESAAYERHKLGMKPPATLPSGYIAVTGDTKLLPGVSVMVGRYGEWVDAQVVRVDKPQVAVHLVGTDRNIRMQLVPGWMAITKETMRAVEDNPAQFTTKIRLAPNSLVELPEGVIALPDNVDLVEGMPVYVDRSGKWTEARVISTTGINVSTSDRHFENWPYKRSDLAIAQSSITSLSDPKTLEEYKKQVAKLKKSSPERGIGGRPRRVCDYPIGIAIPAKHKVLSANLKLEAGTVMFACWGSKWYEVYARGDNGDGTIHIHWKDWDSDSWDCNIDRKNLIIADATVKKLQASKKPKLGDEEESEDTEEVDGDNANESRTWSDSTGKFKVAAKFLRRTKDEVILLTDDGKHMKVKIDRLSQESKDFLDSLPEDAQNPFAE